MLDVQLAVWFDVDHLGVINIQFVTICIDITVSQVWVEHYNHHCHAYPIIHFVYSSFDWTTKCWLHCCAIGQAIGSTPPLHNLHFVSVECFGFDWFDGLLLLFDTIRLAVPTLGNWFTSSCTGWIQFPTIPRSTPTCFLWPKHPIQNTLNVYSSRLLTSSVCLVCISHFEKQPIDLCLVCFDCHFLVCPSSCHNYLIDNLCWVQSYQAIEMHVTLQFACWSSSFIFVTCPTNEHITHWS